MIRRLWFSFPFALLGALWCWVIVLPWPVTLRWFEPGRTAIMKERARDARAAGASFELQQTWVPLDRISQRLRRAVIVAEDGNFFEHQGIDWKALREEFRYRGDEQFSPFDPDDLRALERSFRYYRANREKIRGRSTITQQVAKNLYFGEERSILRKLEEFMVAQRLELLLGKDRILEIYLNIAEWGPGIFGAEAAARRYFGRSAENLSADQAASLAATLPHPLTSNPDHRPGRMAWRKELILARMGGKGPVETVPLGPDIEPPDIELPPIKVVTPDSGRIIPLRIDTLKRDTLRRDTLRVDTIRRDTVRRDTINAPR
jgi:monofunctional biosynthetic peptidoglycan transglycosylase